MDIRSECDLLHGTLPNRSHHSNSDQIQTEVKSLLLCVAEYFANCVGTDNVPLIDFDSLRKLFLLLLHSVSFSEDNSELVGLSIVQAWAQFGLFPYRLENWCETAAEILREAFMQRKCGAFVHSAAVRLEALMLLTCEESNIHSDDGDAGRGSPSSCER